MNLTLDFQVTPIGD